MSDSVAQYLTAQIRANQAAYRPEIARILRYAVDNTSVEGSVERWDADLTTVHASLATGGLTDSERTVALKIQDVTVWVITLPYDVQVQTRDRIQFETIDGLPISPFRVFDVRYASSETSQWNQRAIAIEIEPDAGND